MSNSVFPSTLPGMKFFSNRTPIFTTDVQAAQSGKETRIARMAYPLFRWETSFEFLRDSVTPSELQALVGFFGSLQGQWDTFLFTDPYWHTVTAMQFGVGDGTTAAFQTTATNKNSGGFGIPEAIQNFNGTPAFYVNGTLQVLTTNYTLSGTGVITFVTAPAAAAVLTWTGSFYYRCRFEDDELQFNEMFSKIWELKSLRWKSVKL